ncbi:MAG TPA: nucleotide exchange factor GrpE [Ktedonobacteraceae bacterium]|nr:nucleotide exchange factor GrpE [Ktedonobacteraceae bacterium]
MTEEPQETQEEQMKAKEQEQGQEQLSEEMSPEARRIAELEAQLAQVRQEAAANWDKYLRERAEMENFRKRQERLSTERMTREKKALFHKILEVMDNVERALVYQETMDKQALQHTLRMLLWQLNEVLRGEGLTPVASLGEPFNPYLHEAIEAIENCDQPEGTVVEEVLKGYKLGDETLRPARVKVSSGNKGQQNQNAQNQNNFQG